MPPRLLQETKNQGATSYSSFVRYPATGNGRASGRVDCILLQIDYTTAIGGAAAGVLDSGIHVFVDDPDQSALANAAFFTDFDEAYWWGSDVGPIKAEIGGGTKRWTFALYHPFLFRYYFDVWFENAHSAGLDAHVTVFFEEFMMRP